MIHDTTQNRPVIVAHRAGNRPDTALRALDLADAIELDVHLFRGRVEVRHEKVLWPTARLWERWFLLPRSAVVVNRIEEILAVVGPETPLMLDLKCFTTRSARRIRRLVDEERPLMVSSRSWWVLRAFRDRPATERLRSCGRPLQLRLALGLPGLGSTVGIVAHERLLDAAAIRSVKATTPLLYTWAVRTVERGARLAEAGVTGLIVDDLDLGWRPSDGGPRSAAG